MSQKLAPKGMRDFLPQDMIVREEVMEKITAAYRLHGFRPIDTPAMEYLDVLNKKGGDEIAGQIYRIADSELGLRFDLTVPFARVASNCPFPKPFRRYSISKVWRREEPQKGRFREFMQADVDITGCARMDAEAELLRTADFALKSLGFADAEFRLSNRKILDALAEKHGFSERKEGVFRILDKADKIGQEKMLALLSEFAGQKCADAVSALMDTGGSNSEILKHAESISPEGAGELKEIIAKTKGLNVKVDLGLVRGLGYYTGPVFEVNLGKEIGSCGGGGRYDTLLGMYGQPDSATGISLGIERLIFLISQKAQGRPRETYTRVFVAAFEGFGAQAAAFAAKLRERGISAETDLNGREVKKQLEYASKLGIPYAAIIGEREAKEKKATLRDMLSGKEELLSAEKIAGKLEGK
jgi:histidyl-tRNA synthetase